MMCVPAPWFRIAHWLFLTTILMENYEVRAQSLPSISMTTVNENTAHLEWPASNGIFQLEETEALGAGAVWIAVGEVPMFVTPSYQLDLEATNHTQFFRLRQITESPAGTVPDPKTIATALPPNTFCDLASTTAFLYSGGNPVQLGVAPETIKPEQASVVRGKVMQRDGTPLAGVPVAILNHPEYGYTYTRADGLYDLAVNAAQFTVDFQLAGYCPVQRSAQAAAQNYALTEDIIMVRRDPVGTVINFGTNAPAQVAMSSTNTDAAGHANGFLSTVTNPANETTKHNSSSGGLLLAITRPLGGTDSIAYNNVGRATKVTDPRSGGWTDSRIDVGVLGDYSYEVDIACTNSVGDTLSRQLRLLPNGDTSVNYYVGGQPTEIVVSSLNGDSLSYSYDGSSVATSVGADPRFGNQAAQDVQLRLSLPNGLVYNESVTRSAGLSNQIDPFSLTGLTNVTTINGNSYTEVYNATNRTDTLTSPEGRTDIAVSDPLGRIVHEVSPGQPTVDTAYDASARLATLTSTSSAGVAQAAFSYDAPGQLSTLTDALGRKNVFSYDAAGRLKQTTQPDGSVFAVTHDSEGRPTAVTPPGRPASGRLEKANSYQSDC